ncbi:MAG TPA: hypothetical protein VHF50_02075, partial [Solirubrobacterales bacterium]|nr:hypothetical protein [Solirubrobacterales bacterium]
RAGVDSVAVLGDPPPRPPASLAPGATGLLVRPSNAIVVGKLIRNVAKGTAKLRVAVPGPGSLVATDARREGKQLRRANLRAGKAGTIAVPLAANGAGLKVLRERRTLRLRVALAFTPDGGTAGGTLVRRALKLKSKD